MILTGSIHISYKAHIFVMYDSHLCHVWIMYVPYMKKSFVFIYESGHFLTHFMFKSLHDISCMNRTPIFVCDSYMIVQYGFMHQESENIQSHIHEGDEAVSGQAISGY